MTVNTRKDQHSGRTINEYTITVSITPRIKDMRPPNRKKNTNILKTYPLIQIGRSNTLNADKSNAFITQDTSNNSRNRNRNLFLTDEHSHIRNPNRSIPHNLYGTKGAYTSAGYSYHCMPFYNKEGIKDTTTEKETAQINHDSATTLIPMPIRYINNEAGYFHHFITLYNIKGIHNTNTTKKDSANNTYGCNIRQVISVTRGRRRVENNSTARVQQTHHSRLPPTCHHQDDMKAQFIETLNHTIIHATRHKPAGPLYNQELNVFIKKEDHKHCLIRLNASMSRHPVNIHTVSSISYTTKDTTSMHDDTKVVSVPSLEQLRNATNSYAIQVTESPTPTHQTIYLSSRNALTSVNIYYIIKKTLWNHIDRRPLYEDTTPVDNDNSLTPSVLLNISKIERMSNQGTRAHYSTPTAPHIQFVNHIKHEPLHLCFNASHTRIIKDDTTQLNDTTSNTATKFSLDNNTQDCHEEVTDKKFETNLLTTTAKTSHQRVSALLTAARLRHQIATVLYKIERPQALTVAVESNDTYTSNLINTKTSPTNNTFINTSDITITNLHQAIDIKVTYQRDENAFPSSYILIEDKISSTKNWDHREHVAQALAPIHLMEQTSTTYTNRQVITTPIGEKSHINAKTPRSKDSPIYSKNAPQGSARNTNIHCNIDTYMYRSNIILLSHQKYTTVMPANLITTTTHNAATLISSVKVMHYTIATHILLCNLYDYHIGDYKSENIARSQNNNTSKNIIFTSSMIKTKLSPTELHSRLWSYLHTNITDDINHTSFDQWTHFDTAITEDINCMFMTIGKNADMDTNKYTIWVTISPSHITFTICNPKAPIVYSIDNKHISLDANTSTILPLDGNNDLSISKGYTNIQRATDPVMHQRSDIIMSYQRHATEIRTNDIDTAAQDDTVRQSNIAHHIIQSSMNHSIVLTLNKNLQYLTDTDNGRLKWMTRIVCLFILWAYCKDPLQYYFILLIDDHSTVLIYVSNSINTISTLHILLLCTLINSNTYKAREGSIE